MAYGQVNSPGASGADITVARQLAQQAVDNARAAQTTANNAQSTATAALEKANAAESAAGSAQTTATAALNKATANETTIAQVSQTATTALNTANAAKQDASAAKTAAENAQKAANDVAKAVSDINSTINTVPSQNGTPAYTGSEITASWNGFDTEKLTIGGTVKATNVGEYSATFTPKEGFKWPDGTTTAKTVKWQIVRAAIAVPTQSGSPVYTGSEITASFNGYDSAKMTRGGTYKGTTVGSYNASFTPGANYCWPDGSTGAKTVSWSIGRAAGSLTIDKTTMSLDVSNMTGYITPTRAGDGTISATSSNTAVATVAIENNKVKVTAKAKGSVTITVKVAQGTNHTAPADKTCSVTVTLPTTTLSDNGWDVVGQVSSSGAGANYWAVGDSKPLTLNGTVGTLSLSNLTVNAFILGFNHNAAKEGSNRIHWAIGKISGTQVALCDKGYGNYYTDGTKYFNMNHWGNYNYGGWKGCDMRYDILGSTNKAPSGYGSSPQTNRAGYDPTSYDIVNSPVANTLAAALPKEVRQVMKTVTKYTDNTGNANNNNSSAVTSSVDYLFLLSEFEVYGAKTYANDYEKNYQAQYDYFKAGNAKDMYKHDARTTRVWARLRSALYDYYYSFAVVGSGAGGGVFYSNAYFSGGVFAGFST